MQLIVVTHENAGRLANALGDSTQESIYILAELWDRLNAITKPTEYVCVEVYTFLKKLRERVAESIAGSV